MKLAKGGVKGQINFGKGTTRVKPFLKEKGVLWAWEYKEQDHRLTGKRDWVLR